MQILGGGDSADEVAKNAATSLKSATNSNNLYAVCYNAGQKVFTFLQNDITGADSRTFNADNTSALNTAFNTIVNNIKSGLSSGFTVTDPMGSMVTLQDTTLTDCTIVNDTITWTPTTGTTSVVDGKTIYTYTLTYTVKLNTEADSFVNDTYYPTNDDTTLSFVDGTGNDKNKTLHFNVPGVKGVKPTYMVTYQYDSAAPAGAVLPAPSTVSVQKDAEHTVATPTAVPGWTFNGWTTRNVTGIETTYEGGDKFNMPNNNVTLTGSWTKNPTYGVTYVWADSNNVPSSVTLPEDTAMYEEGATVTVADAPSATGWTFKGWTATNSDCNTVTITDNTLAMPAGGVTITGDWERNTHKVTYKYETTVPAGAPALPNNGNSYDVQYATDVSVATKPTLDGYTFSGWTPTAASGVTVGTDGKFAMPDNDVVFTGSWTERGDIGYTIKYYWIGDTTTPIAADDDTGTGTFNATVTATDADLIAIPCYTALALTDQTDKSVKLTDAKGHNVVKLYYYKNVTLTANSATDYVYDGNAKSVSGFTGAPDDADFGAITVSRTETVAATYDVNFADGTVGTVDGNGKYIVTAANKGTLNIAPAHKVTYKYIYSDGSAVPNTVLAAPVDDTYHKDGVEFNLVIAGSINGYTFSGWFVNGTGDAVNKLTLNGADVELVGKFTPQSGLGYTVEYYWIGDKGSEAPEKQIAPSKTVAGDEYCIFGGEIWPGDDAWDDDIDGYTMIPYTADEGETDPVYKIVYFTTDPTKNVFRIYYYKNVDLTVADEETVYNGKAQEHSGAYTVTAQVDNEVLTGLVFDGVTASGSGTAANTYDVKFNGDPWGTVDTTGKYIVAGYSKGHLVINPRPLMITGASLGEKTYNGSAFTTDQYTWNTPTAEKPDVGLLEGDTIGNLAYLLTGTDAGNYTGEFSNPDNETFSIDNIIIHNAGGDEVQSNYDITIELGFLKINPITDEVVVEIKGHTDTKYYNGKIQEVNGYDVVDISNALYSASYVSLKEPGSDHAEGKDVGTYYMGLDSGSFVNNNQNFVNVEFVVEDGWLKITNQPVDTGIYTKIIVKITGNSASEVYDGTEKSVEGYTVEISDPRYTEKDFKFTGTAEAKGTFVGEYPMGLEADQFVNINRRFKNVEFIIVEDGVLTITARPITITAGSAEGWVTDCPITCDEWTSTPPAPGDTVVSVKITGVQNGPGSSPNVPSDAVIKNEAGKDVTGNYDITYVNGLLVAKDLLEKEDHFNYVIGYPDGSVQPNGNITRAEVATIFYRLLTDEARAKYTTTDNSFSDIKAGEWYTKAIATLENANIIGGYPDGTFKPNAPITRAEMATIIAKFANLDENGKSFNDIKGHWAQSYVELAAGNGWINGYEDGTFRPDQNISRAETFAMINRVLDRQVESVDDLLPTSQMNMWSDNLDPTQWYYKDVQEATNYHKCDRVNESKYETWTEKVPDIDWAKIQY